MGRLIIRKKHFGEKIQIIIYDENSNVITSFNNRDFQLEWHSIVPDSVGEIWYELVKSPRKLKKIYKEQVQ